MELYIAIGVGTFFLYLILRKTIPPPIMTELTPLNPPTPPLSPSLSIDSDSDGMLIEEYWADSRST